MDRKETVERYSQEGEVTTTHEDVAERVGEAVEVDEEHQKETATLVLRELEKMTISDLVREALAAGGMDEVESIIQVMKDNA